MRQCTVCGRMVGEFPSGANYNRHTQSCMRQLAVIRLLKTGRNFAETGKAVGLSRERVRQICRRRLLEQECQT